MMTEFRFDDLDLREEPAVQRGDSDAILTTHTNLTRCCTTDAAG